MTNNSQQELIIVGGGVAACSAGIFAGRRGIKTLLIAKDIGGQTASTSEIENYPGIGRIEGPRLIETFAGQAQAVGCNFCFDEVTALTQEDACFKVSTRQGSYISDALILAFGKTPKNLGVPDEERFVGRGLHYCNTNDVERYRDKVVAVVGGGNSALEIAWKLSTVAKHIYVIHRRDEFRAEQILLERLAGALCCEKKVNVIVTELHGKECIESITIKNVLTNTDENLAVDGVIAAVGFESRTDFVKDFVLCDAANRIEIDNACATSRQGVFAAGDVTTVAFQQIIISAGDGAKAALSAYQYLSKKKGKRPLLVDWGFIK